MRERTKIERKLAAMSAIACLLASGSAEAAHGVGPAHAAASLFVGRTAGSSFDADCARVGCDAEPRSGRLSLDSVQRVRATLVEFPVFDPTGRPRRPHHGIGLRSTAMESALQGLGINAHLCFAPVLRMHTKLSSGLNLSGTLTVSLRCTFH